MNIYDQLQALEDRYEELGELLSDPDIVRYNTFHGFVKRRSKHT